MSAIMLEIGVTQRDIDDLRLCGSVASKFWHWRKLFYAIKDRILSIYGQFDGYDLQRWIDEVGFDDEDGAEHKHILKRFLIRDNLFHIPTNEFSYFNFDYQNGKQSKNYAYFADQCKNVINGKRDYMRVDETIAWTALKRLVRRHGMLVKDLRAIQPELELEHS